MNWFVRFFVWLGIFVPKQNYVTFLKIKNFENEQEHLPFETAFFYMKYFTHWDCIIIHSQEYYSDVKRRIDEDIKFFKKTWWFPFYENKLGRKIAAKNLSYTSEIIKSLYSGEFGDDNPSNL